jgi:uncharacterized protein
MLKQRIDAELKAAMLAGDKPLVSTLRGLKSAILYAEVAKSARDDGLADSEITELLSKESKKRQESADLYTKGGNQERAASELAEKAVIDAYLPAQLNETELRAVIDDVMLERVAGDQRAMGQIISAVKARTKGSADGAVIARLVKERLG